MAIVDVGHVADYTGGLNVQVSWLGRRVGATRRADLHSSRWTGWTLVVAIGHDGSTINIVFPLFIIIIIIKG